MFYSPGKQQVWFTFINDVPGAYGGDGQLLEVIGPDGREVDAAVADATDPVSGPEAVQRGRYYVRILVNSSPGVHNHYNLGPYRLRLVPIGPLRHPGMS